MRRHEHGEHDPRRGRDRDAKPEASVSEGIREISREGTLLELRRLDDTEVGALLEARAGQIVPRALALRVRQSTDGNPLFVDQVGRLLAAHDAIHSAPDELPIPSVLRDTIRSRLDAFDAASRPAIEAAAVLGRDFTPGLLAAMKCRQVSGAIMRSGRTTASNCSVVT